MFVENSTGSELIILGGIVSFSPPVNGRTCAQPKEKQRYNKRRRNIIL